MASGPSLTLEDVELVREWRAAAAGRLTFVTNTTFRAAPWADVLYGMDAKWWNARPDVGEFKTYADEAKAKFKGEMFTCSQAYRAHGLTFAPSRWKWSSYGNSGAGAINLARHMGAKRILLLGYDCQRPKGKAHWHGDHPKQLGNAMSYLQWPDQFKRLSKTLKGKHVEVLNCSRSTALVVWPRVPLEEALGLSVEA